MMRLSRIILLGTLLVLLSACASTPPQEPQIQRISPEELERIMPKPVPNLSLDEIVKLSKDGVTPEQIIEKIKASNSRYDLTPSQAVELSKQGVSATVLDYMYSSREQALRDGFADEINKREKARKNEEEKLRREYELQSMPYYDPFWGYPYWAYPPYYGPSFRYYRRR
jgi:hypothetical protein